MATFTIVVSPGYDFPPGIPIGLDELRKAAKPNLQITGGLESLDNISATIATVTGQALVWNQGTSKWEPSGTIKVRGADLGTMVGASASNDGTRGAVPQPLKADREQFLRGDGLWATPGIAQANMLFNYFNFY